MGGLLGFLIIDKYTNEFNKKYPDLEFGVSLWKREDIRNKSLDLLCILPK